MILPPWCLLLAGLGSLLGLGPVLEGLLAGPRLLLVCAPVRYLDFLCGTLLALHPTRSAKSACLALLATVHISLADLEVQQMDPVAELDVFWFVHFFFSPEGLCSAHFLAG